MQILRWGIVGCGNISHDFIISLRLAERHHQVVAAASRSIQKATEFVKQFESSIKPYGSYAELFEDPDIDIVYIGVQNIVHASLTIAALNAGKHVLCEKPLAVNAREAREMIAAARKNKRFLMEAMWTRFLPSWQEIRRRVVEGELGTVKHFDLNLAVHNPRFNLEACETPSLSLFPYCGTLALFLFNEEMPIKIHAIGEKNDKGFEQWLNVTLIFKDGRHATFYYDWAGPSSWTSYISGDKAQIQIPGYCWAPIEVQQHSNFIKDGGRQIEIFKFPLKEPTDRYRFMQTQWLYFEADHVFDQLEKGRIESDVMSFDTSIKMLDILDEIRRQADVCFPQDFTE